MKHYVKIYIDKLVRYMPVAIFMFTVVFYMNIAVVLDDFKAEYGAQAIDELISIYNFYFIRTILLTLFIPFYDTILSTDRLSYTKSLILHYFLVAATVLVLFYQLGSPIQSLLLIFVFCTLIYAVIRIVIYIREKQFIDTANQYFRENSK